MPLNVAVVRELVEASLSADDLSTFCFDHFPAVYEQFTDGQTKGARVRLLVEYAGKQRQLPDLLARLRHANPAVYAEFAPRLAHVQADRTDPAITPQPVRQPDHQGVQPVPTTSPLDVGIVIALKDEFRELHADIAATCHAEEDPDTGNP